MYYPPINIMRCYKREEENRRNAEIGRRTLLQSVGATGTGLALGGASFSRFASESTGATTSAGGSAAKSFEIIDDFEDLSLEEYEFDRGVSGATVQSSTVANGDYALELSGTNTEMISTPGTEFPLNHYPKVGETFSTRVYATGGANKINFTYGVQDHDNRYFVRVNFEQGHFGLWRCENSSSVELADTGVSLTEDMWYRVEIDWATDGTHTVTLYAADGSRVAQLSATDTMWEDGGIGYDAYLDSGETVYFDYVVKGKYLIDDFEDGNLSEYSFDRGSSGASLVSSPTYHGSTALEISETNTELISTSGLNTYPQAGDAFRYHVRATDGADDVNLTYGVQDHTNRYLVRIDFADDNLQIWRHEGGTSYVLAEQNSGFALDEDTWYEVGVEWAEDGTHTVRLFDAQQRVQLAQVTATDSTWTSGGIGYDAYLGTGGTVYFDYVTMNCTRSVPPWRTVIDDFEDSDLDEYRFDRGSSGAEIVTHPTRNWQNALAISGTNTEMISTSGLPGPLPDTGDVFSYWVRAEDNANKINLTYGVQDHDNRYFVRVNFEQGHFGLWRYESASSTELADTGVSLSQQTWYEVEVDWRNSGTHVVTLLTDDGSQVAQIEASDSTWEDGGIGYDAYLDSGETVYFDYVTKKARSRPNGVTITGDTGDGSTVDYELVVSDDLAKGELADDETVSGNSASGTVADGSKDSFEFSGEITRFTVVDHVELKLDRTNQKITVTDLRSSPSSGIDYEFSVSGNLTEKSSAESGDHVSAGTATGSVTGDSDAYDFTGDLLEIRFPGSVLVDVDFVERPLTSGELEDSKAKVKNSDQYSAMESTLNDDDYVVDVDEAEGRRVRNSSTGDWGDSLDVRSENRGVPCRAVSFQTEHNKSTDTLSMMTKTTVEGKPLGGYYADAETLQDVDRGVMRFHFNGGA